VELAASRNVRQPSSVILAAISRAFTITYVAKMLGEDEYSLHELSIEMFPEVAANMSSAAMTTP
jgi:hypothetical protein